MDPEELLVVRKHEVLAESRPEVLEAELLEAVRVGRTRLSGQRRQITHHALVRHIGRETERIGLIRIPRVHAMTEDATPTLDEHTLVTDQALDPRPHLGIPQMEQVAGPIEAKSITLSRDGVATHVVQSLVQLVVRPEMVRSGHAGEAGSQYLDWRLDGHGMLQLRWARLRPGVPSQRP